MAPHYELVDPAGQNYDLQTGYSPNDNGLSNQIFGGRQPLWNERVATTDNYSSGRTVPNRWDGDGLSYGGLYDGLSDRDTRFSRPESRFEKINDYRNQSVFDNPYNHLRDASEIARTRGPQAAMREYQSAIIAADHIDQNQVAMDMQKNNRDILLNEQRLKQAEGRGAARQQIQALEIQRDNLEKQQQFLNSMRMAPAYTRANAAFCFISKGDNSLFHTGESLLNQALKLHPEMDGTYYFNMHRDLAYKQHQENLSQRMRMPEVARPSTTQLRSGSLDVNPYEPQVPPIYNPNAPQPRMPFVPQTRVEPVTPRVVPKPGSDIPRHGIDELKPGSVKPKPNVNNAKPGSDSPNQTEPTSKVEPALKPFDYRLLQPSKDVYSPAGPPGLGESAPGETFKWEKDGKGGWDIDWRSISSQSNDTQGNVTYHYDGEIDDSSPWVLGLNGDTNFKASETWTPSGQLLKREMTYDGSLTYKVMTDSGSKELNDVHKVTSTYNESTKTFDTEIECSTGAIFKAQVDLNGKVTKFEEVQTKVVDEAPGLPQANIGNFNNSGDVFHVGRPVGVGGAIPGWAGGDNGILDWRESQVSKESNGNVTYKYKGEIEDSTGWLLNLNGDTNFDAQEVLDSKNNLVSSYIKYDSSKDMKFIGVGGQPVSISNVVEVRTSRQTDGSFVSSVKNNRGDVTTFKFRADGVVTEVK